LIDSAIVTDFSRFTDDHAKAMINEYPATDSRAGMDFNTGHPARNLRNKTPQPFETPLPTLMRQPMQDHRMQARITGQDLPSIARRRVALNDAGNIFSELRKHNRDVVTGDAILIFY